MGLSEKWATSRERSRREREEQQGRWRRAEKRAKLASMGVTLDGNDTLTEAELDEMIAAERERQSKLYTAFARTERIIQFRSLGVQVIPHDDRVYTIGTHDDWSKINTSRLLGPLRGAQATVTDGTSTFSLGKAMLMPLATAPLARKETADAIIVFTDGATHTVGLDGSQAVREARKQVVEFNALAGSYPQENVETVSDHGDKLRRLQKLMDEGLLTEQEYNAKRAEIIDSI